MLSIDAGVNSIPRTIPERFKYGYSGWERICGSSVVEIHVWHNIWLGCGQG